MQISFSRTLVIIKVNMGQCQIYGSKISLERWKINILMNVWTLHISKGTLCGSFVIFLSLQPLVYPQATWCGFRKGITFLYPGIRWKQGTMSQLSLGTRSVSNVCCRCNAKLITTACAYLYFTHCRYCCVRRGGATARSRGLQTQLLSWPYLRGGRTSLRCEQ